MYTPRMTRKAASSLSFGIATLALAALALSDFLPTSMAVVAFVVFALFISGAANFTQMIPAEVMPTEVRSTGVGFAAAVSRVASALGTFLTPIILAATGTGVTLGIMAIFCGMAAAVCLVFAPNSKEVSLDRAARNDAASASEGAAVA